MHLCCRVLRWFTPVFFLCQEKRSGLRYVPFLFRVVGIAICRFSCLLRVIGLRWFTSGCAFLYGDSDGGTGDAENGRTEELGVTELAARRECVFAQSHWLCNDTAGSTLGLNVEAALRPPQTAPKSQMWKPHCGLSGLSSRCGGVCRQRFSRIAASTLKSGALCGIMKA